MTDMDKMMIEKVARHFGDGFLRYACPGDEQQSPPWILRFADKDCGEQVFIGETAEQDAWEAWSRYAPSYNCYLFQCAAITAYNPDDRLREALELFVGQAVFEPETHRASVDEFVVSKARAALQTHNPIWEK